MPFDQILIPVEDVEAARGLLPLASALCPAERGEITLLGLVALPPERSLSHGTAEARALRQRLMALAAEFPELPLRVRPRIRVSHCPWEEVLHFLQANRVSLMLLPWNGDPDGPVLGAPLARVLQESLCDLLLVRGPIREPWRRILLPVRGGPYTQLAVEVALALAEAWDGQVTLLHAASEARRVAAAFRPLARQFPRITRQMVLHGEIAQAVLEELRHHDGAVLGAPTRPGREEAQGLGPLARALSQGTEKPLILARAARAFLPGQPRPRGAPAQLPISVLVDKWFAENTFDAEEFSNLEELVALKRAQGVTISLGLPTLNEEATIGPILDIAREALMERYPLLDEIVVIDSASTDRTREIAREKGVPVYIHPEILPEVGSYRGKGEALWKSLYVLRGDLIVWTDTDITNYHPRFIYGLIGPLLRSPRIGLVKGFYRRPIRVGERLQAGGGGRVTELVARPLINLFFPELSGLIQPLSGEYAGRREILEQVPFFTGYGVEIGLLIDILERFGLWSIAQVDLQERIHRNQDLEALSKMAFAIIQVVIRRLEDRHKIQLLEEVNRSMKLIRHEPGRYYLEVEEIGDAERPPMITLPAYRERFRKQEPALLGVPPGRG
ncbi:glucosyl-3-phosphoglycerate synthase [Thermoflexus sp.]|jgi:glucosyl-3-phosphoglycerate synthase|uniref:glucosyl-3-phosphoglycerate synthase n=1 Tax=Thermoflexus sp. TaxID=1969742 RepID=UPI002632FB1A|nr:glucosyl-3-phosphoglycerate synthase [Thermoflexus sp.]